MTPVEHKFHRRLRITRFLNAYLPLSLMRFLIKKSINRSRLPEGVTREEVYTNGVRCEWLIPQTYTKEHILLYFHGGGFVLGLTSLHLEMIAFLAHQMGMRSLVVDYRTAPEHPFPASLDDCVSVYQWLLQNGYTAKNIVFAGDSAGGNLAITSIMKLRDDKYQLPAAVACLSPVGNLAKEKDTYKNRYDPVLHPRASKRYRNSYIAGNNPKDPLISPVYGHMNQFPPLLLHAGENEILKDDVVQIEQLARRSGVNTNLEIYPRMWHVWQIYPELPQTIDSLNKIASFLTSFLK